ncbi:hypothetical protein [Tellurirhabdus bombi]|uniref:hypothetical protein n=1 Tax=Tellurirhabdus bombi TaxID=2907205 RepID=UPI001F3E6E60|nr:hypothetical protein [Tellurirhabdus bombi]
MCIRIVRVLILLFSVISLNVVVSKAQQPTGSTFPNRYTGRQIVVTVGNGEARPEYRMLENGLLFYRNTTDSSYQQLGQQPKEKTQALFKKLEQELKVKTVKATKSETPDASVAWKKSKTQFNVSWEGKDAPDGYRDFYEDFLKLFPKKTR